MYVQRRLRREPLMHRCEPFESRWRRWQRRISLLLVEVVLEAGRFGGGGTRMGYRGSEAVNDTAKGCGKRKPYSTGRFIPTSFSKCPASTQLQNTTTTTFTISTITKSQRHYHSMCHTLQNGFRRGTRHSLSIQSYLRDALIAISDPSFDPPKDLSSVS